MAKGEHEQVLKGGRGGGERKRKDRIGTGKERKISEGTYVARGGLGCRTQKSSMLSNRKEGSFEGGDLWVQWPKDAGGRVKLLSLDWHVNVGSDEEGGKEAVGGEEGTLANSNVARQRGGREEGCR